MNALDAELALDRLEGRLATELPAHITASAHAYAAGTAAPSAISIAPREIAAVLAARGIESLRARATRVLRVIVPMVIESAPAVIAARAQDQTWPNWRGLVAARDAQARARFGTSMQALVHGLAGVASSASDVRASKPSDSLGPVAQTWISDVRGSDAQRSKPEAMGSDARSSMPNDALEMAASATDHARANIPAPVAGWTRADGIGTRSPGVVDGLDGAVSDHAIRALWAAVSGDVSAEMLPHVTPVAPRDVSAETRENARTHRNASAETRADARTATTHRGASAEPVPNAGTPIAHRGVSAEMLPHETPVAHRDVSAETLSTAGALVAHRAGTQPNSSSVSTLRDVSVRPRPNASSVTTHRGESAGTLAILRSSIAHPRTFVVERGVRAIIVVPARIDTPAARFAVMHELGHALLWLAPISREYEWPRAVDEAAASYVARMMEANVACDGTHDAATDAATDGAHDGAHDAATDAAHDAAHDAALRAWCSPLATAARARRLAIARMLDAIEHDTEPTLEHVPWALWNDPFAQAAYVEAERIADVMPAGLRGPAVAHHLAAVATAIDEGEPVTNDHARIE